MYSLNTKIPPTLLECVFTSHLESDGDFRGCQLQNSRVGLGCNRTLVSACVLCPSFAQERASLSCSEVQDPGVNEWGAVPEGLSNVDTGF